MKTGLLSPIIEVAYRQRRLLEARGLLVVVWKVDGFKYLALLGLRLILAFSQQHPASAESDQAQTKPANTIKPAPSPNSLDQGTEKNWAEANHRDHSGPTTGECLGKANLPSSGGKPYAQ